MKKLLLIIIAFIPLVTFARLKDRYFEIMPLSNYIMGKNVHVNYGWNIKKHTWYIGMATHIWPAKKEYSVDGNLNKYNGYPEYWYHHFHPNIGYQRRWKKNDNFDFKFCTELLGGTIALLDLYYDGLYKTENGVDHMMTRMNLGAHEFNYATYLQLTIATGCNIKLNNRLTLTNQAGAGISVTIIEFPDVHPYYRYLGGGDLIFQYAVGLQYHFK